MEENSSMSERNVADEQFDSTFGPTQRENGKIRGNIFYLMLAFVRSGRIVAGQQSM